MKSISCLVGLEAVGIVLPMWRRTLLYRFVYSCIGIDGDCVRDQVAQLSLDNRNAGVGSKEDRDIRAISFERLRRPNH